MDFVVGDVVRCGFGFANPNHAAAAICALFPFCWGWRSRWRWVGLASCIVLFIMLVMTYSRTGVVATREGTDPAQASFRVFCVFGGYNTRGAFAADLV